MTATKQAAKVVITGADGFTGGHLAHLLQEQGYVVHGLRRSIEDTAIDDLHWHACDLTNPFAIADVLDSVRPNRIVHLAAVSFVAHGDVEAMYRTNVIGTRNLLDAVVRTNCPVNSLILASSANIYGNRVGGILTEESPPEPANDYAVSKLAMEYVGRLYAERLPIITVRPFNYTGVGQAGHFLIPKIVDHIRQRASVIELGNLDVERDFSDVRSVVAAYAGLLEEPSAIGRTLNICSGRSYSLRQVLDITQALADHQIEVRVNPAFVRQKEVRTLSGSRAQLDVLLPSLPNLQLEETLQWMLSA